MSLMLDEETAAAIFSALAYEPRMEIIRLLAENPEGLSGIEIADGVGARRNTVTIQLLLMEEVGLIVKSARARTTTHRIRPGIAEALISFVSAGFCAPPPPPEATSMRMAS